MNEKEAIRRNKLYYEGLERAIAQPVPEEVGKMIDEILNDPEQDEDYRTILHFWKKVVGPLDVAIAFVHDNRVLPQHKEIVINDETETPFMQPDEIFNTLRYLAPFTAGEFLAALKISSDDRKQLLNLVEANDKEGFVSMLESTHCDTTSLARLCSRCMGDAMAGLFMTEEERAFAIDHLVGTFYDEVDNKKAQESVAEMQSYYEREEDNPESTKKFYADFMDFLVNQLTADLHYYWNYYDIFTLKERNLIEPVLDNPQYVGLVNEIWDDYRNSLVYTLPDDFFNSKCDNDDTQHLYLKPSVENLGVEAFTEFINYVAEKGFIENSPSAKNLFAYRLSGYYRPEEELPTIIWNGKNNKSYELIYILRYLCDRADYKKMRRFFEGCDWVKEKDSSYAISADSEFRRRMSDLFPSICPFN